MTKEALRPSEDLFPAPTDLTPLNFLRLRGPDFANLITQIEASKHFFHEWTSAWGSLANLVKESAQRKARVEQLHETLKNQWEELESSRAVGLAYLQMFGELSASVPARELFDFFKLCLAINTKVSTKNFKMKTTLGSERFQRQSFIQLRQGKGDYRSLVEARAGLPPAWFDTGDRVKWQEFILAHANLAKYLKPNLLDSDSQKQKPESYGVTLEDAFPDWLTENGDLPPEREVVERELAEDTVEKEKINQQAEQIAKQLVYLASTADQKYVRTVSRVLQRKEEIFPKIESFQEVLIFLNGPGILDYGLTSKQILSMSAPEVIGHQFSYEKARSVIIKAFAQEPRAAIKSKEIWALFIERKLRERKIISSVQESVDGRFSELLRLMFEKQKETPDELFNNQLQQLKEADKHAYYLVRYDLGPLFADLSGEAIDYLLELTEESRGSPLEPIIWELAEAAAQTFTESPRIIHLKDFAAKWLTKSWQWLLEAIRQPLDEAVESREEQNVPEAALEQTIASQIEEIESDIRFLQKGNLAGWRLYYSSNRRVDSKSLVEIGGTTLAEREKGVAQLIGRESIPCTIPPLSIIDSLDWLVTVPGEIERVRQRKIAKGVEFKVLKRGTMRILYVMDSRKRSIIFNLHKKREYRYRF